MIYDLRFTNKSFGFTLIEILVVIGVLGVIMTATVAVLSGAFRGKGRVEVAGVVEQNGSFILGELRKLGLGALGSGISCPAAGVGQSVVITNYHDGGVTTLGCVEGGQIASSSANGQMDLVGSGVRVSGCGTFVSCDTLPVVGVAALNFNFRLSLGTSEFGGGLVERSFQSRVVVRN